MEMISRIISKITVIEIKGEIDHREEEKMAEYFKSASLLKGNKVILHLGGLPYINSAVLGIIVKFYNNLHGSKGKMVVCNLNPFILNMFRITHISEIIKICPTEKEALEELA
ncbi:MAG: STAS domain-containing protein [Candidatus Wallbacteria bacterium]|nr:STAS domain-containing protein [Candidatus Wallbacteria bacterium]